MAEKRTITMDELTKKLGKFISVENTPSRNGYNNAPNQFEIRFENGRVFQSYSTLIAARVCGELYLTDSHDYSNTTSAHTTRWTGYTTAERRAGLKDGRFINIID
jgi:hypothetical protein